MLERIPTPLLVFVAFLAVLVCYTLLQAAERGVLDELLLLLGGGVAGVAAPRTLGR
jgi:hypothetical protein